MNSGLAIRSVVTLLAVGCVFYTIFLVEPGDFPFDWRVVDSHTLSIEPLPDTALPPSLQAGDRIDLREHDLTTRAALYTDTLPGESYALKVRRDGSALTVPVTKILLQDSNLGALFVVLLLLALVLGLSTLWWGRDWAAWGLSFFAIGMIVNFFLFELPLPPVAGFSVILLNESLVAALSTVGLYVSALALSGTGLTARLRLLFHLVFGVVLLMGVALVCARTVGFVALGDLSLQRNALPWLLYVASIFIPVLVLVWALARAEPERRSRLRWIIWSLALFLGPLAWNNLANISDAFSTRGVFRQTIWWSAMFCGLAGLVYSVLRKRVVAMSFAVNRALVYGLIVAFVIGVFALLAAVVENTAIGRDAGLALTLGVSLGIGLVLEALRDRINAVVERLFFRRMYEADAALRRFAHHCAYIERPDRLLAEAEAEIHRHVQPRSSAIYESSDSGYVRIRQRGEHEYPERVDVDDRAFVAMRADREAIDLGDVQSALGNGGYAFPMAVRGVLRGALVCGERTEEYTRDERKLLAEVAHQVGIALYALRARDNEVLVRGIANGELDPIAARERAQALHAARAIDA
ncbi:MAG: hypothetical protein ACREVN_11455 [Gammaproteobacteria bacterium]